MLIGLLKNKPKIAFFVLFLGIVFFFHHNNQKNKRGSTKCAIKEVKKFFVFFLNAHKS